MLDDEVQKERQVRHTLVESVDNHIGVRGLWVLQDIGEYLRQGCPGVDVLKQPAPSRVVLLQDVSAERRQLVDKEIKEAAQHSRGTVDTQIGGLAEKEGDKVGVPNRLLQLVDDAAEEHGFAIARIAFETEQVRLFVMTPLEKVGVLEYPMI